MGRGRQPSHNGEGRTATSEQADGLLNEFALVYKLRHTFPLHYIVFKQVSSHMCHEANSEQLFSRAGNLSDEEGATNPEMLAVWSTIASNMEIYRICLRSMTSGSAISPSIHVMASSKSKRTLASRLRRRDLVANLVVNHGSVMGLDGWFLLE